MDFQRPPPEVIPYGMRAMKMVAIADGAFSETERNLLADAQTIYGTSHDIDALEPIEPVELARHITDPALRKQIVRGMVLLSLIDGEASVAEAAVIERFARALQIDSKDLNIVRHLADKNMMRVRFDIARRFWARDKAVELVGGRGIGWVARTLAVLAGLAEDKEAAARFKALKTAPEGTLGRAYADFLTSNNFSFPGEKGAPPEVITLHDMTHVLSGYGTNPEGELQVLGFHAGCRREEKDPFSFLMFGIAEFHLGIVLTPVAEPAKGKLNPMLLFKAIERGRACSIDPTDDWDPWSVMHEPLEELRARYGIPQLT